MQDLTLRLLSLVSLEPSESLKSWSVPFYSISFYSLYLVLEDLNQRETRQERG